jgi:predicted nucleic acid-binding protein
VIVVDASALAAVMFLEAEAPRVVALLADQQWHAPAMLPFELTNIARTKMKQTPREAALIEEALEDMLAHPISFDPVDFKSVLNLAIETGLSAYDASYLWLSRHLGAPLVTLDRQLAAHAKTT